LIGVNFAKALAYKYDIPIIPVNHLEGHITAAFSNNFSRVAGSRPAGPMIALLVSGGHTQLILIEKLGQYRIIGETRDDAAGECFDKVAKLLGLGYPGGPVISAEAERFKVKGSKFEVKLPRPMISQNNFDFSFSGLKTAVLYLVQELNRSARPQSPSAPASAGPALKNKNLLRGLCRETQQAIIDVLISKTFKAVEKYKAKTVILSGGVAANKELRKQFEVQSSKLNVKFLTPVKNLCMDNGAMIAMSGWHNRHKATKNYSKLTANANLRIK
jgi:N6-L-threonylcarbamoyladenine synthase